MSFSLPLHRLFATALTTLALALATCSSVATSARAALPSKCHLSGGTVTCTYTANGVEQRFLVPGGVNLLSTVVVGAAGASTSTATGGAGASVSGRLAVSPGQWIYVEVGSAGHRVTGGFNGGGNGGIGGGGGGGASDVRTCSRTASSCPGGESTLDSRLIIAAGGGGAGEDGASGGDAGSTAQPGLSGPPQYGVASGDGGGAAFGDQTPGSGGVGGAAPEGGFSGAAGNSGALAGGGAGVPVCNITGCFNGSGGGGGGWYGGGSGGGGASIGPFAGVGGGGGAGSSGYTENVTSARVADAPATGVPSSVTISYVQSTPAIASVSPPTLGQGATSIPLAITGSDFVGPIKVGFSGPGTGVAARVVGTTSTAVDVVASVSMDATPGRYDIVVTNPDGGTATCYSCLTVAAGPKLQSISPSTLAPGSTTAVTLTGTGFSPDARLYGPAGVKISGVRVSSDGTTITATATVSSTAAAGTGLPLLVKEGALGNYGSGRFAVLTIS
jgi:hypothetical protein